MSQSKLKTSEQVFYRIRWDARFDAQDFVIGYESHSQGMLEVPLADFVPGGEIPWHRVWYIARGVEVVWDRRERIDRIFGSGETPRASVSARASAALLVAATEPAPSRIPAPALGGTHALRAAASAHGAYPTEREKASRRAAIEAVERACRERLGAAIDEPVLYPFGSYRMGVDGSDSDVDVLCVGPASASREELFETLPAALARAGVDVEDARAVGEALVPVLKMTLGGVRVDLSYAAWPEGEPAGTPDARARAAMDPVSQRSTSGWMDTEALLACVRAGGAGEETFRTALRAVKLWARARRVYSHAFGYLGGFSWALMTAWAATHGAGAHAISAEGLVEHFFDTFAAWEWPRVVAITEASREYTPRGRRDAMPVVTPSPPCQNSARNVTRSTGRALREELQAAREIVRRVASAGGPMAWRALFAPMDPIASRRAHVVLDLACRTASELATCAGWVEGHALTLVLALEASDRAISVRPFAGLEACAGVGEDGCEARGRFVMGLSRGGPAADAALAQSPPRALSAAMDDFVAAFDKWADRPRGARLTIELLAREALEPGA